MLACSDPACTTHAGEKWTRSTLGNCCLHHHQSHSWCPEFRPLTWEKGPLLHKATATTITSSCSLLPSPSSFLEPRLLHDFLPNTSSYSNSKNALTPQAQDRAQGRSKQCYALVDCCPFSLSFHCPHLWAKGPIPTIYQSLA